MAYRFTNTDKWSDSWFLDLKPVQKLLFLYLCDQCDIAGFVEYNERKFAFDLGTDKQGVNAALEGIKEKILFSADGKVIFVINFIKHQKNFPLDSAIKVRASIIRRLEENLHLFNFQKIEQYFLTLTLPSPKGYGNSKGNSSNEKGVAGGKTTAEPKTDYDRFNIWLDTTCPNVRKIQKQITEEEFRKLKTRYSSEEIQDILEKMENTKGLPKKYIWTYKTALNWLERRTNYAK